MQGSACLHIALQLLDLLHLAINFYAILLTHFLNHTRNNFFTTGLPFLAVLKSIVQVLARGYSKDTTLFKLLCQWNNIKVKESEFTFPPALQEIMTAARKLVSGKTKDKISCNV